MAGHAYKSAVEELDNIVSRDLVSLPLPRLISALTFPQDAPFRATVLEPVGKLCSYFPTVNEGIAKRNKKVSRGALPYLSDTDHLVTDARL
jgi:hypothetical protein